MIWSYILEYENNANPYEIRKDEVLEWKKISAIHIEPSENVLHRAELLSKYNIKSKDALHLSCAIEGNADYFITTDQNLIKKKGNISELQIINPINFIESLEN